MGIFLCPEISSVISIIRTFTGEYFFLLLLFLFVSRKSKARNKSAQKNLWKQNLQQSKRAHGLPYNSRDEKACPGRQIGPTWKNTCKLQCQTKFSQAERQDISLTYWNSGSYERQRDFICSHVQENRCPNKEKTSTSSQPEAVDKEFVRSISVTRLALGK